MREPDFKSLRRNTVPHESVYERAQYLQKSPLTGNRPFADCKMGRIKRLAFVLVAIFMLGSGQAFADLIGNTVTVDYLFPDISTVNQDLGTGTVTAGGFTTATG